MLPSTGQGALHLEAPSLDRRMPNDPIYGEAAATKGIANAARGADSEWWQWANEALLAACCDLPDITADDVWLRMGQRALAAGRDLPETPNHSAMGAVFRHASERGDITATHKFRASVRPVARHRNFRVWTSWRYVAPAVSSTAT